MFETSALFEGCFCLHILISFQDFFCLVFDILQNKNKNKTHDCRFGLYKWFIYISISVYDKYNVCSQASANRMSNSTSIVPLVLWGSNPPAHTVSCVACTYNQRTIITGTTQGQLGIWDLCHKGKSSLKVG